MKKPRFRLRTLMAAVVASAVLFAWVRAVGSIELTLRSATGTIVPWCLVLAVAYRSARVLGPAIRGPVARSTARCLASASLFVAAYLAWAVYRLIYQADWWFQHDLPYPDPAILALNDWFDARHPAPPDMIKIHGELPRVHALLHLSLLAVLALGGLLLGLLAIPQDVRP